MRIRGSSTVTTADTKKATFTRFITLLLLLFCGVYNPRMMIPISAFLIPTTTTRRNATTLLLALQRRGMVSIHGSTTTLSTISFRRRQEHNVKFELSSSTSSNSDVTTNVRGTNNGVGGKSMAFRLSEREHKIFDNPPDPMKVLSSTESLDEQTNRLFDWITNICQSKNILALTGAGLSTESGIPDYRGHNGSYHKGHKPVLHDQYMKSEYHRKRYWGRGMIGWRFFNDRKPNVGHLALADLENLGMLGVHMEDKLEFYDDGGFTSIDDTKLQFASNRSGRRQLSLITQNVDTLHRRAGSKYMLELHGRTDQLYCMNCGHKHDRVAFHNDLESMNHEWFTNAIQNTNNNSMRADGDASIRNDPNYNNIQVPSCTQCKAGFYKPNVVFFGDTVPTGRVLQCQEAINPDICNGLLVIGSSLAVHSAFRHVRSASQQGIPICIVNVGLTRAEVEGLDGITKIEAPAGPILSAVVDTLFPSAQKK